MKEWLVADGLGGYAMGAADGIRRRRYHAYLIVAAPLDERRFALVNDIELWIDAPGGTFALSSHRYAPNVVYPDGAARLIGFEAEPWPTWRFDIGDGIQIDGKHRHPFIVPFSLIPGSIHHHLPAISCIIVKDSFD